MEENLDSPPTRRAAERRTRSSRAEVPRGSPASREQQQSIRLVTNAWTRVDKSFDGDAPYNDLLLQLWHDLNDYKKHDTRVLFPVQLLKYLRCPSGIITEECADFSPFSNRLPDS